MPTLRTTPGHITQPAIRRIIPDFRKEILQKRWEAAPPKTAVINFRDDQRVHRERPVYNVPIGLLRYRKENGRICSSVLSHERAVGPLNDTDQEAQDKIAKFLREKDPEKTEELRQLILADGQKEPAIITCDGFLIDGNRRRLVIHDLHRSHPHDQRFESMKVVILPGPDDEGGPPTLKEIEQIENRYQLQRTGKAEYYGFDAALSIRAKIERGFPLEDQLPRRSSIQEHGRPGISEGRPQEKRRNSLHHFSALIAISMHSIVPATTNSCQLESAIRKDVGRLLLTILNSTGTSSKTDAIVQISGLTRETYPPSSES